MFTKEPVKGNAKKETNTYSVKFSCFRKMKKTALTLYPFAPKYSPILHYVTNK